MILFTALIAPYFIDWTSYRDTFERQASAYVGRPVTVAGRAGLRLLPTPVVTFTDVRVGDAESPDVEMERFRAEVELAPLLRGEVRILQMAFERPVFRVDIADIDKPGGPEMDFRLDPQRVSLERLEIDEGVALIFDSSRDRVWRAEAIDAVVEADTLMGPGKAEARFTLNGRPLAFSIGFGRLDGDSVVAKASLRSPDWPVTISTDGTLRFAGEEPPQYEGSATIVGIAPADDKAPRTPWADFRANGGFALTAAGVSINTVQISYGATERPIIMEASGGVGFGDAPRFRLSLGARQIDLDRALGGTADAPVALEEAVPALLERLPTLPLPPIPGELTIEAQGVVIGGGVIQAVAAHLTTDERGWVMDDLAATLPGETRVTLQGDFGLGESLSFTGHAHVASRRPPAFAAWWTSAAGGGAAVRRFALDADLAIGRDRQTITNLVVETGAGRTTGTVDVSRFPSGRYFVAVDLAADRADLAETRALAGLVAGRAIAPDRIETMTLALRADALLAGGAEARSVNLEGGYEDGALTLRRFSVADLAGASIDASGTIRDPLGNRSGTIEASVHAEDFRGAAAFIADALPDVPLAARLRAVAPSLSPAVAEVSAEIGADGGRLALSLTGSFAATHLLLQADGKGSLSDPASLSGRMTLHADGADSATVLRQLGFAPLPIRSAPLAFDAEFSGAVADAGTLTAKGSIAGIGFDYTAATSVEEGALGIAGDLQAESGDIDQALLLAGVAVPGIGEGHAASLTGRLDYTAGQLRLAIAQGSFDGAPASGNLTATLGAARKLEGTLALGRVSIPTLLGFVTGMPPASETGAWSDAPFAAALPGNVAVDLLIRAAALDLGAPVEATDADLAFRLEEGAVALDLTSAGFAGGTLKGSLAGALAAGEAKVTLRGSLKGGDLQQIVWNRAGLPVASGAIDLSVDASGHGRSAAAVVATLSGAGSFTVEDGRINALNPAALTTVMAAAEGADEPDETEARETFARLFGSGAVDVGRVAGSFSLDHGQMTIPTVSLASGTTGILADATFDLNRRTLASRWQVRTGEAETARAQPSVQMRFSGPIAAPGRDIDINPLLNLLRSRFLQRQLAELEALEAERKRAEAQRAEEERLRLEKEEAERKALEERTEEVPPPPGDAPGPPGAPPDEPSATGATDPAPLPAEPLTAPFELVPEAEPAPASAPPPPSPPARRAAQTPPAASPSPPPPQSPEYRQLPNGTIVKIR